MNDDVAELSSFETQNTCYDVGVNAKRIWLARDGAGPMGWYDRIHVQDSFGNHCTFPAHHVLSWVLAKQEEN